MISYKPFYETLWKKDITEYHLIFHEGFSANTFYRMKQGKDISTKTINSLCETLDCSVPEIIEYVKEM